MQSADIERKSVKRLDQALNLWEQACFLAYSQSRIELGRGMPPTTPLGGPLLHYSDFRRDILRSARIGEEFPRDKYLSPDKKVQETLGTLGSVPQSLYGWNQHSRRVFTLNSDISRQLAETDLEGVLWSDVRFPFKAYGMQLESPISLGPVTDSDFILVNEVRSATGREGVTISLLPTYMDEALQLSKREIERLSTLIARRRWTQAHNMIAEIDSRANSLVSFPHVVLDKGRMDFPVTDSETAARRLGVNATQEEHDFFRDACRLVVGFSLYLKQLPVGTSYQSEWRKVPSSADPTVITNEAQVCYITSTHPLVGSTSREEGVTGIGSYEMPWHERRGYWSRERGQGDNPLAPKIVWHAPTEVRRDRKPVGIDSIPGGAQTSV